MGGWAGGGPGGCEPRIEFIVNLKKYGGSGGCDPRIETIVKLKSRGSDRVGRMSKQDFQCQKTIFGQKSNVKIGFRMSKFDIRPQFECQNRTSNVKMRYSARIRMSK